MRARQSECLTPHHIVNPHPSNPGCGSLRLDNVFSCFQKTMLPLFKPSTRHFITATITSLQRTFGGVRLRDISTELLQSYVSSLRLTPKTVANRMTVFRTVWKSARTWGYVNHDPFVGLVLPKLVPPEPRCFTLEEATRIILNAREPYKTLYLLAAETGMRGGEICALHWSDVDLEGKTIRVARSIWKGEITTPKTRAGRRVICISEELVSGLDGLRSPREGTVFATMFGTPMDPEKVVQRHLRPLLKKRGIAGGGLHAFRHFNATMMDRNAVPMKIRQKRLGHSSPTTTLQLYTHVLDDEDRRAALTLGKHLVPNSGNLQQTSMFWWSSTCWITDVPPS